MELVDIGFNFTSSAFRQDEIQVIERANAAGVTRFILTGSNVNESEHAIKLSTQFDGMHTTAGVHPHLAKEFSEESLNQIRKLAEHENVVAIGEAGIRLQPKLFRTTATTTCI